MMRSKIVRNVKKVIALIVVLSIFMSFNLVTFAATITKDLKRSDIVNNTVNGSSQHSGYSIAKTNSSTVNYTYTGEVFTSMSSLYDYKSDVEIAGNTMYSNAHEYSDPYTQFNTAISNDGDTVNVISEATNNITFTYNSNRRGISEAYVYLFDNNSHNNTWPGYPLHSEGSGIYKITVPFDEIGFTPTTMIISGKDINGSWQTDDIQGLTYSTNISLTYSDYIKTASSNNMTIKLSKNDARVMLLDGVVKSDQNLHLREGNLNSSIKANVWDDDGHSGIYTMTSNGTDWQTTFDSNYLNNSFYISFMSDAYVDGNGTDQWGNVETDAYAIEKGYDYVFAGKYNVMIGVSEDITSVCKYDIPLYFGCFYRGNSASSYNNLNRPNYDNFYWQANISQRPNVSASIKGLVDNELHNDKLTQNNQVLPYFNSLWVEEDSSRANLMESYENLWFPYYKMRTTANTIRGSTNETTGYAEFYQFNSKDNTVYFDGISYVESNTKIHSQGTTDSPNGTVGFYPFNNVDNNSQLNLGFGSRFDVSFRLSSDGKVETVDSNGKPTRDKVNAMFEFIGDDDVWVYIDGKLVLDLGGCHKDATGLIDFAERKVYTNESFTFDADNDVLDRVTSTTETDLESIFSGTDMFIDDEYNEVKVHTLTLFYMERGMYESDLLMRFNFAVIPNENILRVVNLAAENGYAFSAALEALLEDSVFVYELENSGTNNLHVTDSEILYPSYDVYSRNNSELQAGVAEDDTGGIYLDTSYDLDGNGKTWDSDGAIIGAYLWGGGQSAKTVLAEQIDEHLYRVDIEDYTNVHFMRIAADCVETFPYNGYLSNNNSGYWNRYQLGAFTAGATYSINGWNSGQLSTTDYKKLYNAQSYNYDPDSGAAVANTSYKWVDNTAELVEDLPDGRDGITGITDDYGRFGLFAGSSKKESSVEFVGQFAKGSTIRLMQTNLVKVNNNYADTDLGHLGTKVSEVFERIGLEVRDNRGRIVSKQSISHDGYEGISFTFDNAVSVPGENVVLTVYITNDLDVGPVTLSKTAPGYLGDDECTFQIELRNLFGVQDYDNNIDYTKLSAEGSDGPIAIDVNGYFDMKIGDTVTIYGIPTLCEYQITEVNCSNSDLHFSYSDSPGWISIGNNNSVNVENTYDTWNATVYKQLQGDYSEVGITDNDEFDVSITITSMDYDLSQTVNIVNGDDIYTSSAGYMTASSTISVNSPLSITGLPPDAEVIVEENEPSDEWFDSSQSTMQVTLNCNNTNGHIVNYYRYAPVYSLTVSKEVTGDYDDFGVEQWDDFGVNISIDTSNILDCDLNTINVYGGHDCDVNWGVDSVEITGYISQGNDIIITGIPGGATYNVSEDLSSRINTNSSNSTYEAYGQINSDTNVTIRNFYTYVEPVETYSLTVNKNIFGNYSDYNINEYSTFDVTINLEADSNKDLSGISVLSGNASVQSSGNRATITASISSYDSVEIMGIPENTQYSVVEDNESREYTDSSQSYYEFSGTITSDENVTLSNYYEAMTETYSLTISKTLSGEYELYNIDADTEFLVHIDITGDENFDFNNVSIYGLTGVNSTSELVEDRDYTISTAMNGRLVIDAKISQNRGICINGIQGLISYYIEEDIENLALDLDNSIYEYDGRTNDNKSLLLLNDFLAFDPYVLPAAGMNDMYGVMFSVALVLVICTLGYSYSSYKRRHDNI